MDAAADPARATRFGDLTRRGALGLLGAGATGFILFGPRGAKEDAHGRIVLDYWEKWTGHEMGAMQSVVDDYNASQSKILVRYFVTSNIGQKALVAIAGGSPPDIVGLWNFNVPAYAASGAILPLDELAAKAGLKLDQYLQGVRQVMIFRGRDGKEHWYGVVNTAGTLAMYYNKSIFREAGLDPEKPPRTIEEMDAANKAITKLNADGSIARTGFLHAEPGWWSWLWGYHFGGSVYDETSGMALVDSPQNLAAYKWMRSYPAAFGQGDDRRGAERVERFRQGFGNYNTPQNAFLAGKVAMVIQGPWLANMLVEHAKDLDYGVAPFPVAAAAYREGEPVALVDTDVLCIPRGAKHPEASMEFIAFTQRQDMTERLALAHCKICPLLKPTDEFVRKHPNRGLLVHNALAASSRAFVVPKTRAWPEFKDDFDATVQRLWRMESEVEPTLKDLQTRAQGYIDRSVEQERRRYGPVAGGGGAS
ncbi:MAG: ABC transporter substrate-binding protein [Phycisphaerales bacterium]